MAGTYFRGPAPRSCVTEVKKLDKMKNGMIHNPERYQARPRPGLREKPRDFRGVTHDGDQLRGQLISPNRLRESLQGSFMFKGSFVTA